MKPARAITPIGALFWAISAAVLLGPVLFGAADRVQPPPEPLSKEKNINLVQFREGYKWKEGRVLWETEERIGIQTNGTTIPYQKKNLEEIRRYTVSRADYLLEKAREKDNTYTVESYREAISLVKKALDAEPDHEEAQKTLKEYKDELERLTRLQKQEAEAKLANRRLKSLSEMQKEMKNLREKVEEIDKKVNGRKDQALNELHRRVRQLQSNVGQLHSYYRELEDDVDDLSRYGRRGGSYFYYYRRDSSDRDRDDDRQKRDDDRDDGDEDQEKDSQEKENSDPFDRDSDPWWQNNNRPRRRQ